MTSADLLRRVQSLHPKLIDLSLDRIERLLAALDHPEQKLPPAIQVAGTNGKGSTVAFLRALLEASGRKVQVYISPHLVRFHERIRLTTGLIGEGRLADVLTRCEDANGGDSITFFEITTAAALLAFAEDHATHGADFCLLEVGLGGRYDATSVAHPAASVITPVALDHQSFLGDTIAEIAYEKAGIIRPGVPVFCAPQDPDAMEQIETCATEVGAPLHIVAPEPGLPPLGLMGDHQKINASLAVACLKGLGVDLSPEVVERGLAAATWPARLQRITSGPLFEALPSGTSLWLDGGHNPHAARAVAQAFQGRKVDLISGMMANRDPVPFFEALAPITNRVLTVPIPGEAAHTPEALAAAAQDAGLDATPCASLEMALATATTDEVLVCGSLYLAGQMLEQSGLLPD